MQNYSPTFYQSRAAGALSSAEEIVPIISKLIAPKRVIDLGCGTGEWLSVFQRHGTIEIKGVDGIWVDESRLRIPKHVFFPFDFSKPFQLDGPRFDLAVSLEVAEHLSPEYAPGFVRSLTELAPIVLFSAAIPNQGGTSHLNEQWQGYWVQQFQGRGYVSIDCLRWRVWDHPRVKYWYAQNMLLFANPTALAAFPLLQLEHEVPRRSPVSVVHPTLYLENLEHLRASAIGFRKVLKEMPRMFRDSVRRYFKFWQ